jgi:hypothetical protein
VSRSRSGFAGALLAELPGRVLLLRRAQTLDGAVPPEVGVSRALENGADFQVSGIKKALGGLRAARRVHHTA